MRKYLQNQEKHKVKKVAKKAEKSVPRGKPTVGKLMNQRQGLTKMNKPSIRKRLLKYQSQAREKNKQRERTKQKD